MLKDPSFFYKFIDGEKIVGGFWFNKNDADKAYLTIQITIKRVSASNLSVSYLKIFRI
jgi:hypothetical protein